MRIILLGNAGAGKSTMARRLIGSQPIARLPLDEIAWGEGTQRQPLDDSLRTLHQFLGRHDAWIIEGCYGDMVEATWAAADFKDTLLRCEIGGGSWLQDGSSAGNSRLKRSSWSLSAA